MGCNPNWSYITQALMLMLQINHWRLVQTGLTGHCDVAFAFVFALIILYKWTLGCFFTDSDSDNQWSRFHRIDIHFTLLGVGLGLCESGLDQKQFTSSPIERYRLIVQLLMSVLPHPPRLFLIPVSPITLELVNGSVFIYWRFSL